MITRTEIEKMAKELAQKIDSPEYLLPTFSSPIGDATPNIEVDASGNYHFVVSERGTEYERKTTTNLNELLFWMFKGVTFSMACNYELRHRIADKDARRILFAKQEELMGRLNKDWETQMKVEHASILGQHPFDDLAGLRATHCRELRAQGLSEPEIVKRAYKKYPA
jgi:hypothetical protein